MHLTLCLIESVISPLERKQLLVIAHLRYTPFLQDDNPIRLAQSADTVSDGDGRPALNQYI